ncbi:transporter substrate-binding domain-containing protein [Pseudodesulfovibrio sp.]|uniref:transporter substrate-binding domain-containing protein n=1 Tax=Pseudodesulfovibrio sp. TaxID=2035812 RepID=UPI00262651EE|nr:transporter substrate-binding domain-containing protein [Pseudodesulfovibrio sp.]MDD3311593.1 transporter substrate-binding domain-containing protein [Pseudodesulfovibrio sp.]
MKNILKCFPLIVVLLGCAAWTPASAASSDLDGVKARGELRHLGIPYANFVTGQGDGLSVELMQRFAAHLGVKYRFVPSAGWDEVFGELTGSRVRPRGDGVEVLGRAEIRGDVIANGLTDLAWRRKVVDYSDPTFPTQVWCIARADFPAKPIAFSGDIGKDIGAVKALLKGYHVMGKNGTCLAPGLYGIEAAAARATSFPGSLNDIAPAIIKGDADLALLDVPDSLVALEKWPGKIKVLGPISPEQAMGVGFRKDSPRLREAFNAFFARLKASGEYRMMVAKYYPAVFGYYKAFFEGR